MTQAEVNALRSGISQTLSALQSAVAEQVYTETFPLVGSNFQVAWSNGAPGFHYLTWLRGAIVSGLTALTNQADYAPTDLSTIINSRLSSTGFVAGSQVVVSTPNDTVQLVFTTSDTYAAAPVPIAPDLGLPNMDLRLMGATNAFTTVTGIFNFTCGVDAGGFYLDTETASLALNTGTGIGSVSTPVRFVRLPYTLTDNTTNRTSVPLNFTLRLRDPNNNGQLRLGELAGEDILHASVGGNTRLSFRLLSSLPASAMLPQIGTNLRLSWDFAGGVGVDPADDNADFGNRPILTLEHNRINLESFFNSFAEKALRQIDDTIEPMSELIDVLTTAIPVLSDLGSDDVTVLDVLGVDEDTVAAIGGLAALLDLANLADSFTGNSTVFADLGSYAVGGDLRTEPLADMSGGVTRVVSSTRDADLTKFMNDAAKIQGLAFPLLTDANVAADLLLGRNATLFTWHSGEIEFSEEFRQFFPVLGPVGVTLGGRVGLKTQFGFGYDTQGIFDYYLGGSSNSDLLFNGFFALAIDEEGDPLTGITLSAGITAGVEANLVVASVGVEGDITAEIGMYLDDLLGDEQGRVRGTTLLNTPVTDWFYAAGSLTAGLRAYLEVGFPPVAVSYDFESPRVTLISFDSQDDVVPVLGTFAEGDQRLTLNVGDRAPLRIHGDIDDRAEEFTISNSASGLTIYGFNESLDFPAATLIVADANLRGDVITVAPDVLVPVHFSGGPGFDSLTGGAGNDLIEGNDGPDKLKGGAGNDTLNGGADNDELNGGLGNDTLDGGDGLDTASWLGSLFGMTLDLRTGSFGGAAAGDTLISIERYAGTEHDDVMDGSESDDTLLKGNAGNDTVRGHGGHDLLEGSSGDDTLEGGFGDDMLIGGTGADTLDGGPGTDTLSYLGALYPVSVSLRTGIGTAGDANGDLVSNFEVLMGSGLPKEPVSVFSSGDTLEGSDNADTVYGMDGADEVRGAGGNDILYGNHPDAAGSLRPGYDEDRIFGGAGDDMLFGGADDDQLDGEEGSDQLDGGLGNDYLLTFDLLSVDRLEGGEGINRLSADYSDKSANLRFTVSTNNAFTFPDGETFTNMQTLGELRLGSGQDVVRLANAQEHALWNKTVDAGAGDDLVIADWRGYYPAGNSLVRTADRLFGGEGVDTLSFEQSIAGVTVNLSSSAVGGAATGMTIGGFENIVGTEYVDTLTGDTNDNIIYPLRGRRITDGNADTISGSGGMDTLVIDYSLDPDANAQGVYMEPNAVTGYESIDLRGANARALHVYVGIERFHITGGAGNDVLFGEGVTWSGWSYHYYSDRFFGGGGNDYIEARLGDDYVDGGDGDDTLDLGAGNDVAYGGDGNDLAIFIRADNSFSGFGADLFHGGPGNDTVRDFYNTSGDASSATASTIMMFDGGEGIDTLYADLGNVLEPFIFNSADPTDLVFTNGSYIRNFEIFAHLVTGSGNDLITLPGRENNVISLRAGNDIINPGLGIDNISGGAGDDLLVIDYSVGDDNDTTGVTYNTTGGRHERRRISTGALLDQLTMGTFERMHFTGSSKRDVAIGSGGDDRILGEGGDDDLSGSNGNDWIDGGPGADVMKGNHNNDTYVVDNPADVVTELSSQGTDTIRAGVDFTIPASVEHMVLTGSALNGTGNSAGNIITGNAGNNYLRGEGGNDVLNGGGGVGEIDRLHGGIGADTYVLADGDTRFYDDGSSSSAGENGYAIIEDFMPSHVDRLRLAGTAAQYLLGPSPITAVAGTALYHDSNSNSVLEAASDELIAVLTSPETLTRSNTVDKAVYTRSADPAAIGFSGLTPLVLTNAMSMFAVELSIFEPMDAGVLLEIQSSSDVGQSDPWLTVASKNGTNAWTGSVAVAVSAPENGRVTVTVQQTEPMLNTAWRFYRAKMTRP